MSDYLDALDNLFAPAKPAEKPEQPEAQPVAPTQQLELDIVRESYAWAVDVFWVYQRLGQKPSQAAAGGKNGRYALWVEARKDPFKYTNVILPKAMMLLDKARAKEGDSDEVEAIEAKDIAKMKATLKAAVREALEAN